MQFPSPLAARSSPAAQAAPSSEAAAPAPGQPGPSCPAHGASRGGRPGTSPAGRVEEEEEEEEEESSGQDPHPIRNTWLRYCHFFLKERRREPVRAMGGCEVREFLLQFGFFLPLLTAWTGDCSHVSNQGKGQAKGLGQEAALGVSSLVHYAGNFVHWVSSSGFATL
ncbi:Ephrin type-A receptor 6 [Microtus ochrogaster]|uniref:Ephrin type-A receptor 6 n=1 Tax=Microtus ochrogaster TaxID=79684 RepID=A0A8J6FVL8_MICOH|nr:Ephrin type-A receptor 6 [Microtus ochrogaster]